MVDMKGTRRGFTLIEVALFLAVSGLLFIGITVGVQSSIKQQRYNDSVQNFAEFLRTAYSQALNVQHAGTNKGRSGSAIYGKLITFGESRDLDGHGNTKGMIFSYDIIANANASGGSADALSQLKLMNIRTVATEADSYTPRWSAKIQKKNYEAFKGAVLIVRHPSSGIVYTYYSEKVVEVNSDVKIKDFLNSDSTKDAFQMKKVDFCVNPEPGQTGNIRKDVRIIENARNSSGIVLVPDDGGDNECRS